MGEEGFRGRGRGIVMGEPEAVAADVVDKEMVVELGVEGLVEDDGERRPCHSKMELKPPRVPQSPWFNRETVACCSIAALAFMTVASDPDRDANKSMLDVTRIGRFLPLLRDDRALTSAGDCSGARMSGLVLVLHGIFVSSSICFCVIVVVFFDLFGVLRKLLGLFGRDVFIIRSSFSCSEEIS